MHLKQTALQYPISTPVFIYNALVMTTIVRDIRKSRAFSPFNQATSHRKHCLPIFFFESHQPFGGMSEFALYFSLDLQQFMIFTIDFRVCSVLNAEKCSLPSLTCQDTSWSIFHLNRVMSAANAPKSSTVGTIFNVMFETHTRKR